MTHLLLRRKAIELRKSGRSYSEIRKEVIVSKSTLSRWLKDFPLSKDQIRLLRDINPKRIERFRTTMKNRKKKRLLHYYQQEKNKLLPLSSKELLVAGLFLYWGEGGKVLSHTITINNTEPSVIKFSLYWLKEALHVPKSKIRVFLHLYKDMNIEKEIEFWSMKLNISKNNFLKPYVKESKLTDLDHKGYGHGTCGLLVYNTKLKEKILMAIKALADYYGEKLREV
jgi:hypothetical protein